MTFDLQSLRFGRTGTRISGPVLQKGRDIVVRFSTPIGEFPCVTSA